MLCAHHAREGGDRWADNNRCMCDLLHRGRVLPRLPLAERQDEFCEHAEVRKVVDEPLEYLHGGLAGRTMLRVLWPSMQCSPPPTEDAAWPLLRVWIEQGATTG